jgi:hypothetical protein
MSRFKAGAVQRSVLCRKQGEHRTSNIQRPTLKSEKACDKDTWQATSFRNAARIPCVAGGRSSTLRRYSLG